MYFLSNIDGWPRVSYQKIAVDTYFLKTDLHKGYWQIHIASEDIHETDPVTSDEQYEFLGMSFGMINSFCMIASLLTDLIKKGIQKKVE